MRRLMGFAVLVGLVIASGAVTASADTASGNIVVTTVAAADQPACKPAASKAATASVNSSSSQWVFTINATAPICEPVTAAIYAMPNNIFWPWPQQKVESTTFDVPAGTTTITFAKVCGSNQFDVFTGQAPDRIQPTTGPMHGPLLFEVNPWSATQNFGAPCGSTTTTGVTTTSVAGTTTIQSTTSIATTTTDVQGSTTVPGSTSAPTSVLGATTVVNYANAPIDVKPATQTRASGVSPASQGLAATGFDGQALVLLGVALVVVGLLARRFSAIRRG